MTLCYSNDYIKVKQIFDKKMRSLDFVVVWSGSVLFKTMIGSGSGLKK